jgi:hypothetical protein
MRTTITLDPDVEAALRRTMVERGVGLKDAVNEGLRAGLGGARTRAQAPGRTYHMGRPLIRLDSALRLAAAMEDEELARKLALRK